MGVQLEILKNLQFYNELLEIASENKHPDIIQIKQDFDKSYQKFLML